MLAAGGTIFELLSKSESSSNSYLLLPVNTPGTLAIAPWHGFQLGGKNHQGVAKAWKLFSWEMGVCMNRRRPNRCAMLGRHCLGRYKKTLYRITDQEYGSFCGKNYSVRRHKIVRQNTLRTIWQIWLANQGSQGISKYFWNLVLDFAAYDRSSAKIICPRSCQALRWQSRIWFGSTGVANRLFHFMNLIWDVGTKLNKYIGRQQTNETLIRNVSCRISGNDTFALRTLMTSLKRDRSQWQCHL